MKGGGETRGRAEGEVRKEKRRRRGNKGEGQGRSSKEIVGLVGEPSEVLARTVGDGVRKMMKKGRSDRGVPVYIYVCYLCLTHLLVRTKR